MRIVGASRRYQMVPRLVDQRRYAACLHRRKPHRASAEPWLPHIVAWLPDKIVGSYMIAVPANDMRLRTLHTDDLPEFAIDCRRGADQIDENELASPVPFDGDKGVGHHARAGCKALATLKSTLFQHERFARQVGVPHPNDTASCNRVDKPRALLRTAVARNDLESIDLPFEQSPEREILTSRCKKYTQQM
ncbi:hypothetical protein ASE83_17845 [Sphingomonas sp. Leaf32]|nr:hypothetical protein ASE81_17875 [Sphingomonas sp. Leaf29]KQN20429.1 hypothetical protein ASE83_17845 [Sphingomonas sp. Leaf32]